MDGASRENLGQNKLYTHHSLPVLFLFICIIHTVFWLLGNKKKSIPYTITTSILTHRPPPPLPTPQPVCHPGWQPRSRHNSEDNGWSWRWLYTRGMQSTHFTVGQKHHTPPPHPPASPHLLTRHYFALRWNRSSTCWSCWRKLIPEGIRDIFTDEGR